MVFFIVSATAEAYTVCVCECVRMLSAGIGLALIPTRFWGVYVCVCTLLLGLLRGHSSAGSLANLK